MAWLLEGASGAPREFALIACLHTREGCGFCWQFHRAAPERWHKFNAFYPEQLRRASGNEPIPHGALVISHEMPCTNCEVIVERWQFKVYVQK
ncbi:MAG: hypothetical protein LC770_10165 [Acidobacteria bacterium]|nr:hypothetical protein [Acidobacteriota bacterium]